MDVIHSACTDVEGDERILYLLLLSGEECVLRWRKTLMPFEGLGSMSAMLLVITVITIGAIMAVRTKMRQNAGMNKLYQEKLETMEDSNPKRTETDEVQDLLDNLKKDIDKDE